MSSDALAELGIPSDGIWVDKKIGATQRDRLAAALDYCGKGDSIVGLTFDRLGLTSIR